MESVSGVVTAMNRANMLIDDDKLAKMSDLARDVSARQDDAFADIEVRAVGRNRLRVLHFL